jgi:uncharacterized protein DUF6263
MKPRRSRVVTGVVAFVVACAVPLLAQDVTLKYLWKKGETLRYRLTQENNVNMSNVPGMGDMTITTTIGQTLKLLAEDVAPDGTATVKTTFEAVKISMGTPMGNFSYDSAAPAAAQSDPMIDALAKSMGALVGESITMVTKPNGGITKVSGMTQLASKIMQAMPQAGAAGMSGLDSMLSDEAMTSQFQQGFSILPDTPVRAGANWKSEIKVSNPMAPMLASTAYTLKAVEAAGTGQMARIAVMTTLKASGPPTPNPALPMKVQVGDGTGEGELLFDVRNGRLQKSVLRSTQPMTMGMQGPDGSALSMQMLTKSTVTMELIEK